MRSFAKLEARLRAREAELGSKISTIATALDQPGDPDIEDQASARQFDESLDGVEAIALTEVKEVRRALARISAGTYGHCAKCNSDISIDRLNAVPHAETCAACA